MRIINRKWRLNNKEAATKYASEYYKKNRDKNYGMEPGWFESTLKKQGGVCEICGKPQGISRDQRLNIDHDHSCCPSKTSHHTKTCGKCTRGIICFTCNIIISRIERLGPNGLKPYLDYLDRHRKIEVAA